MALSLKARNDKTTPRTVNEWPSTLPFGVFDECLFGEDSLCVAEVPAFGQFLRSEKEARLSTETAVGREYLLADPPSVRLRILRDSFEALVKERKGNSARLFQSIAEADSMDILGIGLTQFFSQGNEDRLRLTAELLAARGAKSREAMLWIGKENRPERIYFINTIFSSEHLTLQEKVELARTMPRSDDIDFEEKLESAFGWLSDKDRATLEAARDQSNDY